MVRPPLSMGAHGSITIMKRAGPTTVYVARCRFRDYDGVTRSLERHGPTKTAANRALQDEIRARTGSPAAPLRPDHTFERAAERWLAKLDAQVASATTRLGPRETARDTTHQLVEVRPPPGRV